MAGTVPPEPLNFQKVTMIKIEITAGSYAEAATLMAALAASGMKIEGGAQLLAGAAPADVVVKSADIKSKGPADGVKATPPGRLAPAAAAPTKAVEPEAEGVTYLDVKKVAGDMAKDPAMRPKVVAVFAKYGARVGTDLTPEQWAPVIADLNEAAAAGA